MKCKLSILLLVLCSSCMKVHYLSISDQSWLNMYSENDTIFFYGSGGDVIDTFLINECLVDSPKYSFPINENYLFDDYYCGSCVCGNFVHGDKINLSFHVSKTEGEGLEFIVFANNTHDYKTTIFADSSNDNQEYVNFYFSDDTEKNDDIFFNYIKLVKGKGITEYSLSDGHTFSIEWDSLYIAR